MSNDYVDNDQDDQGNKPDPVRAQLKKTEARNKELEASNAAGQAAQKELLFIKAGVSTDTALGKLFVRGYDGELNIDAVRFAAIEATIISDPSNSPAIVGEGEAVARIAAARTAGEQNVVVESLAIQVDGVKSVAELDALVARQNAGLSA